MIERVESEGADLILSADAIHPFDGTAHTYRELAVKGRMILALGETPGSLDALAGPRTKRVALGGAIAPGFHDTHVHHFEGALELRTVQVQDVAGIQELVEAIELAARAQPEGTWIVSSRNWHESALRDQRLPTAAELDGATERHPVCVRRGSHLVIANSRALQDAGLPPSDGQLIGDEAIAPVLHLLPELSFEEKVAALAQMNRVFNEHGIVAIRDPGIASEDFLVYQAAGAQRMLTVRCNVMVRLDEGWPSERIASEIDRWGVRTGLGDEMFRIGGVKLFVDGRIDDAALSVPSARAGEHSGRLHLPRRTLERAVRHAVTRGWDVGCHAMGDVAVEAVIDSYEAVLRDFPSVRPGALVVEHAFLATAEQRRRAARLGIGISVHPPLLYAFGAEMVRCWGERVEDANPIREWLEEGALVAAGSDGCVPPFDPRLAIWNMVTRGTKAAGARGAAHAIDVEAAFRLYTVAGAQLLGEDGWRGALRAGHRADLVAFDRDPLRCDPDELPNVEVDLTLLDGRVVHDRLGQAGTKRSSKTESETRR
ncbi:MAG: amidohydrolase [Solirubrobacteraceae bacterium]